MYVCFDIGGTEIKSAIIDVRLKKLEYEISPSVNNVDCLIEMMRVFINKYQQKYTFNGICLSVPGAVEPNSGVIHGVSALSSIHGFSWKEKLCNIFKLPISIENDANCIALCELKYGAAKDNKDILSLAIGTGIGASIVKNKEIHRGEKLLGGEFGFMIMNTEQYDTFSSLASVGSLVKRVQSIKNDTSISGKDIFSLAYKGDDVCRKEITNFYHNLAMGIYNMCFIYDPEIIVLSGAVTKQSNFLVRLNKELEIVLHAVTYKMFGTKINIQPYMPKLVISNYGRDANLYGAVAHFIKENTIDILE